MVGTQAAMGDIKILLANLAMEEILEEAGLKRCVGTCQMTYILKILMEP